RRRRSSSRVRSQSQTRAWRWASQAMQRSARPTFSSALSFSTGTRWPMRFTDELRAAAADTWTAQREHAFVRGIGEGTLDAERFRWYVRQDYLFLIEYGRVLALASARAPRLELQARFAELAQETLQTEMDL